MYDIIIATLSHVWKKIRIPTWDDLLREIIEMMDNDASDWEPENEDEEAEQDTKREFVASATEPFNSGPPSQCLRAIYDTHKRLPWPKLKRVVGAYNWNTPKKEEVLAWYQAAEKLCRTAKHDFRYYCSHDFPDNGEFVPTWEIYGMYWSDKGPVDYQFEEYMNNNLGNFEPMPMVYSTSAETPLDKVRSEDKDMRMIDDWMVQSCYALGYDFMERYFNGVRRYKRWIKEVYNPIVTKPKSPRLIDVFAEERVNVY